MISIKLFEGSPIRSAANEILNTVFEKWKRDGFHPQPHECYKNARRLAIDSDNYFSYCEGYVTPNIEYHAWNVHKESIIDISIALDGNYYTINGCPRTYWITPRVDYLYCGTEISFDKVIIKEEEVGHFSGGSFKSDGTEKYLIMSKEEIEPAKNLVLEKFKEIRSKL